MSNSHWDFQAIHFDDADPGHTVHDTVEKDGVTITNLSQADMRTTDTLGDGITELFFGVDGIKIDLAPEAQWVIAKVAHHNRPPLTLSALDRKGGPLDSMTGPDAQHTAYLLEVTTSETGPDIYSLLLEGGGGEGVLIWLKIGRVVK